MASRLRKTSYRVGVCLGNGAMTLLAYAPADNAVVAVHTLSAGSSDEAAQRLQQQVPQWGWRGAPCDIVLSSDLYRLQQADTPKVPLHERNDALLWSLRDMMDFPVNEAVLQSFELPPSVQRGGERLYASFCHKPRLQQWVVPLAQSGLAVASIDIPELAIATLLRQQETLPATSAVLFENTRGAVLYVYVLDDLVLSRQLVGVAGPSTWNDNDGRDNDTFLLEVQRTLDFFESQIARRPVQKLFLAPLSEFDEATQQLLQQNLNVRVERLPLPLSDASAPVQGSAACLALAAALRAEHATH